MAAHVRPALPQQHAPRGHQIRHLLEGHLRMRGHAAESQHALMRKCAVLAAWAQARALMLLSPSVRTCANAVCRAKIGTRVNAP